MAAEEEREDQVETQAEGLEIVGPKREVRERHRRCRERLVVQGDHERKHWSRGTTSGGW